MSYELKEPLSNVLKLITNKLNDELPLYAWLDIFYLHVQRDN